MRIYWHTMTFKSQLYQLKILHTCIYYVIIFVSTWISFLKWISNIQINDSTIFLTLLPLWFETLRGIPKDLSFQAKGFIINGFQTILISSDKIRSRKISEKQVNRKHLNKYKKSSESCQNVLVGVDKYNVNCQINSYLAHIFK